MLDRRLAVYSGSHFAIDLSCFTVLIGAFSPHVAASAIGGGFLAYNFIAFALQMPLGYVADVVRARPSTLAASGTMLVIVGVLVQGLPWAGLAVCALGNALFHLGGGIDSLVNARGGYARPGVFISFGALGVVAGTWTGTHEWLPAWVVVVILLIAAGLQLLVREDLPDLARSAFRLCPPLVSRTGVAILLLMLVILARSLGGLLVDLPWKAGGWVFLAAACVFAGKFAGGMLADRFGARNVVIASLAVAAPLLVIWPGNVVAGCIGLFCFNVMTAVTLVAIAARLPGHPGFAFGLTTMALFAGATIPMVLAIAPPIRPLLLWLLMAVALTGGTLCTSNRKEAFA